jgi:SAM-dependent methyltransferase
MEQKRIRSCDARDDKKPQPQMKPLLSSINEITDEKMRYRLFTTVLCYLGETHPKNRYLRELRNIEETLQRSLPFLDKTNNWGCWEASFHGISMMFRNNYIDASHLLDGVSKFKRCPLNIRPIGKALDFGCNVGWLTKWLKEQFNVESWGVDVDEFAVSLGKFFGAENLVTLQENGGKYVLPFGDKSFDAVVSTNALFSIPMDIWSTDETMGEIHRVLAPGGFLLIHPRCFSASQYTFNYRSMFRLIDCNNCRGKEEPCCDYHSISVWQRL